MARFNFSHGTHAEHKARLDALKALREELDAPVAAMLDTKGPEVRLKDFAGGRVHLTAGQEFTLTTIQVEGDAHRCSITYGELPGDVKAGDTILLDDGLVRLTVLETSETEIRCRVENDGDMKNHKGGQCPRCAAEYALHEPAGPGRSPLRRGAGVRLCGSQLCPFCRRCAGTAARAGQGRFSDADHRQDRKSGGCQQSSGDPGRGGRHHGGSRRYGCGDRLCGDPPDPKRI